MRRSKTRLRVLLAMVLMAAMIVPGPVYADRYGQTTYTWRQVWNGALGSDPVFNSIVDPSYSWDETEFARHWANWENGASSSDLKLRASDSYFGVYVSVRNDNSNSSAVAKGVKVKLSTGSSSYSRTQTVRATITTQNGKVRKYVDSFKVTANRPFKILPYYGTANLYPGNDSTIKLSDDYFGSGAAIGSETNNGTVQPESRISTASLVRVVYEPKKYVAVPNGGARAISQAKAWNLIQKYSKPKYYLRDKITYAKYNSSTKSYQLKQIKRSSKKYKYLRSKARSVTSGKKSDYEKIYAVAYSVASRTYYDDAYSDAYDKAIRQGTRLKRTTVTDPVAIWDKKVSVCSGYALLNKMMLDSIGIPCMIIDGKYHSYNAAYSYSKRRWVFFDSTWMCGNHYTKDGKWAAGKVKSHWFDFAEGAMVNDDAHMIFSAGGIVKGNTVYTVFMDGKAPSQEAGASNFLRRSKWFISPTDQYRKSNTLRVHSRAAGYKVKKIAPYAFLYQSHIKRIYLPSSVKVVGKWAFYSKKRVRTTVITKLKRSKLRLKYWGRRSVKVKKR